MNNAPALGVDPVESRRLARLRGTGLLDSPAEPAFDRTTRLAARVLRVPMSLVSLVDRERQFFKSSVGLPEPWASRREMPQSSSLCRSIVASGLPLVVGDARLHPEMVGCAALAELGVVAYLGVPLITADGYVLGSLCVIDTKVRTWDEEEISNLMDLAASVMTEIELREQLGRSHKVEQELRLLTTAVEQANEVVLISEAEPLDQPGPLVVYANKAFTRSTGYERAEICGRNPRMLQGPKTDRATLDRIRAGLRAWEPVSAELLNYRKDGTEFWVEINIRPVADANGWYSHWVSVQHDVTERKQAEARLHESERTLRAIFDTSFQFIGRLATDGTLLEANRTALEFAGVEADEVAWLPYAETPWWKGSEEQRERLRGAIEAAAGGRFVRFEAEHPGVTGEVITVDFSLTPVREDNGEVVMLIAEGHDISERKRSEKAIQAQERLLALATQAAGLGVWNWDVASGKITWAGEHHRLVGVGAGDFPETLKDLQALLHIDDHEAVRKGCEEAMAERREFRGEYRFVQPDGSIRWIAARGGFIYEEATGQATRMVGVCMDVTARKNWEQETRERAEKLAEADRHKDEFLAMLAHELRNPLAPIAHAVKVLELRDGEPTLRAQMRELIGQQTRSLSRLVDDLLDVTRVNRGKIRLRKEEVDLAAVISRAVTTTRPLVHLSGHSLSVELPEEPVRLLADPLRLEQVLVNLVTNAAKYTDPGGSISVLGEVNAEKSELILRVSDNGLGIGADLLPHVFDPFTQADHTLDRSRGGLGIGLTLVRSLVRMHGGTVEARSGGAGLGSEFVIRLPVVAGEMSEKPALRAPSAPARARALRVLVVDDNVYAAESLALILGHWGHKTRVCHDGRDAIEAADVFRPEVVLLDIGLPGLDGYDVARLLRERPEHQGVVIVAVTGYGREEDRGRSLVAGFDHHFVKPVDLDALEDLLGNLEPLVLRTPEGAGVG